MVINHLLTGMILQVVFFFGVQKAPPPLSRAAFTNHTSTGEAVVPASFEAGTSSFSYNLGTVQPPHPVRQTKYTLW